MIKRSASNSPAFRSSALQQGRPNSVAVAGTLESLVRSLHDESTQINAKEMVSSNVETSASDLTASFMAKATTKAQTSVHTQQAAEKDILNVSPAMIDHQKPSPSHNGSNYQDVLSVEEAVTCSQSDSTYNLTIVRNFFEELISRVQSSLNKSVVSWESVQQRFYDMMTDDDCPDIDLLGRYQLQMYFFQYALDEKVLEVWTGKKSVVEIFASPEFEGLECFREACPPHNLLVMVDRAKSKMETNSVAVGTEDTNIPSSNAMDPFELVESTSCTEELLIPIPVHPNLSTNNCSTDKNGSLSEVNASNDLVDDNSKQSSEKDDPEIRCLDPLPLPNGDAGKDTIEAQLNNSGSTEQSIEISGFNAIPKTSAVAPEPSDLPDPSCMFMELCYNGFLPSVQKRINSTTSDASGSCMNSTKEHSSTAATENLPAEELLIQLGTDDTSSRSRPNETAFLLTPDMSPVDGSSAHTRSAAGGAPQPRKILPTSPPRLSSSADTRNPSLCDNLQGILTVEASREQVSSTVKEEIPVNSSSSESNASKDSEQQITQSEQDPSLKLLQQAGIFPREMLQAVPEMSEENLSQPTCGSVNPSSSFESTPTCFRVSQVDASLGQQPAQAETINGGSVAVAASPDSQSIEIDLKMARSVLEGLEFPDINGDVINHLTFIRKQVLEYHERHAIIPRLENILACLREKISSQWIDYVLYYIPDVSVMPVDGQVFVVWKGK